MTTDDASLAGSGVGRAAARSLRIEAREPRSLFGEILDWMITPLLLLWPLSLAIAWVVAQGIANRPFDRALLFNTQALTQLLKVEDGHLRFDLPQPASEILHADDSDLVYYQVRGADGELLGGEAALPAPPSSAAAVRAAAAPARLRDDEMRGLELRVAWRYLPLPLPGRPDAQALVQVAETREKRSALATEIIKGVMLPQFAALPLVVLLVWLALSRGTRPLRELEQRIRLRRADDLSPIDATAVPLEVAPLVASVNGLLQRLTGSIATQKRFLADAAHQLKTPLAGLRMQADLAQREGGDTEALTHSLKLIGLASERATHSVNQLLALARAESADASLPLQEECDLAALTREVVEQSVPRALEKRIDLGYDGLPPGAPGVCLRGNRTLLQELVRNLVDNAIGYTPSSAAAPGVVTARVLADPYGRVLLLQVEDSGPGIEEWERELVFQPFYRALGTAVDGTGLGLPIVQQIARRHGARISVEATDPGRSPPGARFTVRFRAL